MPAENLAQKGCLKARLLATYDEHHPPQPALSHGQPAAVAWRQHHGLDCFLAYLPARAGRRDVVRDRL
jgi:hypothetical protein